MNIDKQQINKLITEVIKEASGAKIFNNDQYDQPKAIEYLKQNISPLVPYCNVSRAALGNDTIMVTVSFEPKEDWPNKIFENSNYFRLAVYQTGEMEMFSGSLYKKGSQPSRENRLNVKFRKVTVKTLQDAKNKIVEFIKKVNTEYKSVNEGANFKSEYVYDPDGNLVTLDSLKTKSQIDDVIYYYKTVRLPFLKPRYSDASYNDKQDFYTAKNQVELLKQYRKTLEK